jgi:hypothetical protein
MQDDALIGEQAEQSGAMSESTSRMRVKSHRSATLPVSPTTGTRPISFPICLERIDLKRGPRPTAKGQKRMHRTSEKSGLMPPLVGAEKELSVPRVQGGPIPPCGFMAPPPSYLSINSHFFSSLVNSSATLHCQSMLAWILRTSECIWGQALLLRRVTKRAT